MSTSTVDRTGDWDAVPFSGGFAGLTDLVDDEFSGMVTAGPSRLFMLRGAVIGILDGDIEDFEDADGTAREAPHPALPLLAVMQERADEVRAQYYTEETPISEVDRTLADGNFTGFIELSENVLSGDYYQVYHQGHSMSVAYVGASERLIVDDEAFEQADDEVGIYKVKPVDIEVIEIPEPEDKGDDDAAAGEATAGAAAGASAEQTTDPGDEESDDEPSGTSEAASADGPTEAEESAADTTTAGSTSAETTTGDARSSSAPADDGDAGASGTADAQPSMDDAEPSGDAGSTASDSGPSTSRAGSTSASSESAGSASPPGTSDAAGAAGGAQADASGSGQSGAGSQQAEPAPDHPAAGGKRQSGSSSGSPAASGTADSTQGDTGGAIGPGDLETRTLPSLDPAKTASKSRQERNRRSSSVNAGAAGAGVTGAAAGAESGESAGSQAGDASESASAESDQVVEEASAQHPARSEPEPDSPADSAEHAGVADEADQQTEAAAESTAEQSADATEREASAATSAAIEEAEADVSRLESELADLRGEHEDVVAERDRLESELAEAREEIERLRQRLEDATGMGSEASQKLSPRQAIDDTNLFIRYDSKGEATLEKAHAGDVDKAAVDENMRVEYHTSFDADDAAVDGIGFDQFLTDTVQYRFVDWLVRKLLYEIRDTGNTGTMSDLYDALPKVDRAELNGQVGVQYTEDGQEHRAQIGFDVIVRDRMGNPLMVANLNDSRDPATESMMTDLVRAAERVGESSPSLAGAFLVTRSFFEPGALETAEEATAGGLLNRGKQKSFVNLSRKGGYHLCLVEARNDEFHLAVPEL